jgi:hypothetical protein
MKLNKIEFIANRSWLTKDQDYKPSSIIKFIPEWFRKADRFAKNPVTGEFWIGPDKGKVPTWKACPALFDIIGTGYAFVTPCDIEFYINDKGKIDVKVMDKMFGAFCSARPPMPQFEHPHGFYQDHFAWFPEWAVKAPEGYSVLYSSPFNRYDLPFMTVSGIIDNDKVNLPGSMPFFIRDGWTGIIPAGTPYAQLIPFKREDWSSEYVIEDDQTITMKNIENSNKYRVPDGGVYKNEVWTKRTYD